MKRFVITALVALLPAIFALSPAFSQINTRTATVLSTKGTVEIKCGKNPWIKAEKDSILKQGDLIRTRKDSSAVINVDGSGKTATLELNPNSQLQLSELIANPAESSETTLLDLALGSVLIKAEKLHSEKSRFEVKTPTSIVGVRGTTFTVAVEAEE